MNSDVNCFGCGTKIDAATYGELVTKKVWCSDECRR